MLMRDDLGWPVEIVRGHHILNFFRLLILTDIGMTWKYRKHDTAVAGRISIADGVDGELLYPQTQQQETHETRSETNR